MTSYTCKEDEVAFRAIIAKDPECTACFECGAPSPQWCDINHGTFICLNCSGGHRSLGVHLSFVRSSTMDGWSTWKPEKLRQMQVGGNRRARLYFEKNGLPKEPLKARYESIPALRYAAMLEAEALGTPFNEASWQPPEWYTRMKSNAAASPVSQGTPSDSRFAGVGANGQSFSPTGQSGGRGMFGSNGGNSNGGGDFFSALSMGWSAVTQKASTFAQSAQEAIQTADVDGMRSSLAQRWTTVSSSATRAVSALSEEVTRKFNDGGDDEDGLAHLRNQARMAAGPSAGTAADPSRYGHIEHQASPTRASVPGWGSAATPPATAPSKVYSGTVVSESSGPSPAMAHGSVVQGSAVGYAQSSANPVVAPKPSPQKKGDWGWEEDDDFLA